MTRASAIEMVNMLDQDVKKSLSADVSVSGGI